ncbi:DUF2345 domain-containing protein [Cupriavidus sp. H18C2]
MLVDQNVTVSSAKGRVVIEAKEELVLKCGGSYLRMSSTGIEDGTRGDRNFKAASHDFEGPSSLAQEMNRWKQADFDEQFVLRRPFDGAPIANRRFKVIRADGSVINGVTDPEGRTGLQKSLFAEEIRLRVLPNEPNT